MSDTKKEVKPVAEKTPTVKKEKIPVVKKEKVSTLLAAANEKKPGPKLFINNESIPLTKVKGVKNLEFMDRLSYKVRYQLKNRIESCQHIELYHANHDGVDYYLDKESSVTILPSDGYLSYEYTRPNETKNPTSVFIGSKVTLKQPPRGHNYVDHARSDGGVIENTVIVTGSDSNAFIFGPHHRATVLKDVYAIESVISNSVIESCDLRNSEVSDSDIRSSNARHSFIRDANIEKSQLDAVQHIWVEGAILRETYLCFNVISIDFRKTTAITGTLEKVNLHAVKESLRIQHPYQVCDLLNSTGYSPVRAQMFKGPQINEYVVIYRNESNDYYDDEPPKVIRLTNRETEASLTDKLKPIIVTPPKNDKTGFQPFTPLSELENSILTKMVNTVLGRLIVDRTLQLSHIL